MDQMGQKNKYWYRFFCIRCPLCGSEDWSRERVYGIKPLNHEERYVFHEHWDYCDVF